MNLYVVRLFNLISILVLSPLIGVTKGQLSFPECGKYENMNVSFGKEQDELPHPPWSALIEFKPKNDSDVPQKCGGVLIGPKFVLSAAQCFCRPDDRPCDRFRRKNGSELMLRPLYNFKTEARVYLGLKHIHSESLSHDISDILIHPEFRNKIRNDIALVQLKEKVELSSDIKPICLPFGPGFPDTASRGYMAGWGSHKRSCSTDEFGPSRFAPCKFPFTYKGQSFSRCLLTQPPSNEVCLAYEKRVLKGNKVDRNEVAEIFYKNDTLTRCFSADEGELGWCGTCRHGESECTDSDVRSDANWGWCLKSSCSEKDDSRHKFFAKGDELTIFTGDKCSRLLKASSNLSPEFHPESQLCAGKLSSKVRRKKLFELMESIGDDGERSASFFQKTSKFETDVFIGGQESCSGGDMGGPLWRWMGIQEKRAFVVGIVSRGLGCSNEESPGVYTRTRNFLPWILRNTKKGDTSKKLLRVSH